MIPGIDKARKHGIIESFDYNNEVSAHLSFHETHHNFFNEYGVWFSYSYLPDNQEALNWLKQRLLHYKEKIFSPIAHTYVLASQPEILYFLLEHGFFIDSIELVGSVDDSQKKLPYNEHQGSLKKQKTSIERVTNSEQIDWIIDLKKQYFFEHPEFCWFYKNDRVAENERNSILKALTDGSSNHYILRNQEGYVGTCSFEFGSNDWAAGIEFVLHQSVHGLGLGKACYAFLFERMKEQNIRFYKGSTSNPAVMKIGKRLDREVAMYNLRYGKSFFENEHFKDYLHKTSW